MKHMQANQRTIRHQAVIGFVVTAVIAAVAIAEQVPTKKETVYSTVTATVEDIDQATREVTLKTSLGNTVTFTAGPKIKRLNEVKVGDTVTATYYMSFAAELREPTAEEKKKPLTILTTTARAKDGDPTGGTSQQIKAVTIIEGIDRSTSTITVKGPRGRYVTARVEQPSVLEKMKLGDTIVITYTEAIGLSLEKTSVKAGD